jgi:hypothetical protein
MKRLLLVFLIVALGATNAWALFTWEEVACLDDEEHDCRYDGERIDSEYWQDLLAFRFDLRDREIWDAAKNGIRFNGASLDYTNLYTVSDVKLEIELHPRLLLRYHQMRRDDNLREVTHNWFEVAIPLYKPLRLIVRGEPLYHKELIDFGGGIELYFDRENFYRAGYLLVDYFYNDKTNTENRIMRYPGNYFTELRYRDDLMKLVAQGEADTSTVICLDNRSGKYYYEGYRGRLLAQIYPGDRDSIIAGIELIFDKKIETERTFGEPDLFESWRHLVLSGEIFFDYKIDSWEPTGGFYYLLRNGRYDVIDGFDEENNYYRRRREEVIPYLGSFFFPNDWSRIELVYYLGRMWRKLAWHEPQPDIERTNYAARRDSNKLNLSYDFIIPPTEDGSFENAVIKIRTTWDPDEFMTHVWDGGNIYVFITF